MGRRERAEVGERLVRREEHAGLDAINRGDDLHGVEQKCAIQLCGLLRRERRAQARFDLAAPRRLGKDCESRAHQPTVKRQVERDALGRRSEQLIQM